MPDPAEEEDLEMGAGVSRPVQRAVKKALPRKKPAIEAQERGARYRTEKYFGQGAPFPRQEVPLGQVTMGDPEHPYLPPGEGADPLITDSRYGRTPEEVQAVANDPGLEERHRKKYETPGLMPGKPLFGLDTDALGALRGMRDNPHVTLSPQLLEAMENLDSVRRENREAEERASGAKRAMEELKDL